MTSAEVNTPRPMPAVLTIAVRETDSTRIVAGVKVKQRRARGAERETGSETLNGTGGKEPDH
jgi:hypothetical protein